MKPIVFFDLETTGKSSNPDDVRIIEISAKKVNPETLEIFDSLYGKYNNDGVPIAPDATERHGVVEADLVGLPTFHSDAKRVFDFFDGCDVGGYYCSIFDIPILYFSFSRAGLVWEYRVKNYDIYTLWRKHNSGKLGEVYKRLTGKNLEDAHTADADVLATLEVYKIIRQQDGDFEDADLAYFDDRIDIAGNFKFRILENGAKQVYIDFGKWKGTCVDDVDSSYFKWMVEKGGFPRDTTHYAQKIYEMKERD